MQITRKLASALLVGAVFACLAVPAASAKPSTGTCGTYIAEDSNHVPTLTRDAISGTFTLRLDELLVDGNNQPAPACPTEYSYSFSHSASPTGTFTTEQPVSLDTVAAADGSYHAIWSVTLTADQVHQTTCNVILSDWSVFARGAVTDIAGRDRGTVTDAAPTQGDAYEAATSTNCGSGGSYPW